MELYTPGYRPAGLQLETVLGQSGLDESGQRFVVDAYYRLQDAGVLKFSQSGSRKGESYTSPGLPGVYNQEATAIQIGTAEGYRTEDFDRVQLDWKRDGIYFQLSAPRGAMSEEELVQIAAGLEPLF